MKETEFKNKCYEMDIIRGFGIFLVVLGHSGFLGTPWIYMFHMALFFIVSGWCASRSEKESVVFFLKKKIKRLYVPYVIFGSIYVLLHNVFLNIGIYTTNQELLSINSVFHQYSLSTHYSTKQVVVQLVKTVFLGNNEQLLGISWFVRTLLIVSLLSFICKKLLKKHYIIVSMISLLLSSVFFYAELHLPLGLENVFPCFFAYSIGGIIREKEINAIIDSKNSIWWLLIIAIGIFVITCCSFLGTISLGLNDIVNPVVLVAASVAGYLMMYCLAKVVQHYKVVHFLSSFFAFLGGHSMTIMWLHFTCFKIVTCLYMMVKSLPLVYLATFPVIYVEWLWMAYTFVGLSVPLLVVVIKLKAVSVKNKKL